MVNSGDKCKNDQIDANFSAVGVRSRRGDERVRMLRDRT